MCIYLYFRILMYVMHQEQFEIVCSAILNKIYCYCIITLSLQNRERLNSYNSISISVSNNGTLICRSIKLQTTNTQYHNMMTETDCHTHLWPSGSYLLPHFLPVGWLAHAGPKVSGWAEAWVLGTAGGGGRTVMSGGRRGRRDAP